MMDFFKTSLRTIDPEIYNVIKDELDRQQNQIELIASENIVSPAVLEAQGSCLTNKYAEGYPGARYYGGCEVIDVAENLAISRAKELFQCAFANVQPHSGSQANQAVFLAFLKPGDTILAMDLSSGGHLTHGSSVNLSGKWFNPVFYNVHPETGLIDLNAVELLAREHKPKLIIAGGSAYSRIIDFAGFRAIADQVGAILMVDMAHFAGLVAGGVYPSPLPFAHVVTTTTHKTLRGPRGGMILSNDLDVGKKINSAIFPGLQGGPLLHIIAAKAVAFKEALLPSFKTYAQDIVGNAEALAQVFVSRGIPLVSGGTDTHLMTLDLRHQEITGRDAEVLLDGVGFTCNKNAIPFDPLPPRVTSGIRMGTPAATTRGFKLPEFVRVGGWISDLLDAFSHKSAELDALQRKMREDVTKLCQKFPIY
ncbi:MAG: serine hydroxymethyltransferase [Alphaproteobacteria bacterium 16-39-46]|nr:MAG: serine hydroxymethyltransferase [Alphaproteobacteria bacterium 16-39-46]OZA44358.1 MAG: serine hydroxymethyltransferase [Alphaproteobacteria bacterium 17-39-52]HQS83427.1 serine hydroxymethyltransferase [Alphaproteobacteria bacterium]HQS93191.1 serine hydroxymethyltransferase [Alphaproteobacteria bacterium]